MEPILCSLQTVLRGALILGLSLSSFAQLPAAPDTSGFPLGRKSPDFPLTALPPALIPHPAFEFRGIRIGDEMKQAERKFLSLRVASLSSKPGLCGSDGNSRIATCTDVLDTGEYVNMTMLDRRVAQRKHVPAVSVSLSALVRGHVNLTTKYGSPDKRETKYYHDGVETGSSGEHLRWLNGDQYMEGSEIERSVTIGSKALDVEIAEEERLYERN